MANDKSGIYEIKCVISGKSYVGSSCRIYQRWYEHKRHLRKGTSPSPRLQQAWNKHGEGNFVFSILEECAREDLLTREQFHIDAKKRDYNSMPKVRVWTPEMVEKRNSRLRLLASLITHCPKGHEYTESNTYIRNDKRRCKECNKIRIATRRSNEPADIREARLARMRAYHMENREAHNARMRERNGRHKG